ncbi:dynein light chain roadblock-type 1 [Drosophila miranda]|uniref:dynein light chain roadblock-type 1 n=1 Tax=Drosophila miranda TaxID=7229 RepID=UPI0007E804BE|nr:dynein light chain roadblock-type 1 [Drosophila miranda]
MSAEIEEILKRYSNYPNVSGIIIVDSFAIPIKTTMEYTLTVHYAALANNLLAKGSKMVQNLDSSNELTALRLRTLNHELMIVPEENFFIVVVQKPFE